MTITDQPPPQPRTDLRPTWDLVIEDVQAMREHARRGVIKGHPEGDAFAAHLDRVHELTLADMAARDKTGRERYGVPLTSSNGRDQLVDAYQEMLDGSAYLRAAIDEGGKNAHGAMMIYVDHLSNTVRLRGLIEMRDNPPVMGELKVLVAFKVGDRVRVMDGEHLGRIGTVVTLRGENETLDRMMQLTPGMIRIALDGEDAQGAKGGRGGIPLTISVADIDRIG